MHPSTCGCVRVKSREQTEIGQLDDLCEIDVVPQCVSADEKSGERVEIPQYRRLIKQRRPGGFAVYKEHQPPWTKLRIVTKDKSSSGL